MSIKEQTDKKVEAIRALRLWMQEQVKMEEKMGKEQTQEKGNDGLPVEIERLVSLKHGDAIQEILESMYEDWMDTDDKDEFIKMLLGETGITFEGLNDQIETGIGNGYSKKQQIEICCKILKG